MVADEVDCGKYTQVWQICSGQAELIMWLALGIDTFLKGYFVFAVTL